MSIPSLHRRIKELSSQKPHTGTLLSFTTIRHPPAEFGTDAYTVGLIKRADGRTVCAQLITDQFQPQIGAAVAPRMRRIRTMDNGLFVNDLKYEIVAPKPAPQRTIQHYVLAFSGPSGVGKTTITRALLRLFHVRTEQLPIFTTRTKKNDTQRSGHSARVARSQDDQEPYIHISEKKFNTMIESGEIIAHSFSTSDQAQCGYRKIDIETMWKAGKVPIVIADVRLLEGLAQTLGRRAILSCGLLPPGKSRRRMLSTLLHRLRGRGRETEQEIRERLESAESDINAFHTHPHLFDHLLVNDELELCVESIAKIVGRT